MNSTVIFPSSRNWATPRADNRITTENAVLKLPMKIDSIDKVLVKTDSIYGYFTRHRVDGTGGASWVRLKVSSLKFSATVPGGFSELDISEYIIEESKYQTMPNEDRLDYLHYSHNSNYIYLYDDYGDAINGVVYKALDSLMRQGVRFFYSDSNETYELTSAHAVGANNEVRTVKFRVYYTPLGETVSLTTPKTEPQEHQFTIPFSQQQPIVSSQAMGKNMQAMANRTGVPVRIVTRKVPSVKLIRKIGTIWREKDKDGNPTGDIWRLTAQDIVVQGGYAICTERWSKNWMMQSEFVGINREFRSWKIPADIVQRNLHYQDYCYITSDYNFALLDDAAISTEAKKGLLRSLDTSYLIVNGYIPEGCEGTTMFFYRKYGSNYNSSENEGVIVNCSAMGFGNSLVFSGKTKDNLSAGTQRVQSDEKDNDYQYCKDVYYCKEDGTLDTLTVCIASGYDNEDTYLFPEVKGATNSPAGACKVIDELNLLVLKDPAEQLNFTYQLHLLTHDPDLIIGAGWANNCPLVVNRTESVTLKYWTLTRPLPKGAQTMSDSLGTPRSNSPVTIDYKGDSFEIESMTCITDEQNNIIVAYNGTEKKKFYMKYTHDYDEIQKKYNALHADNYKDATYKTDK